MSYIWSVDSLHDELDSIASPKPSEEAMFSVTGQWREPMPASPTSYRSGTPKLTHSNSIASTISTLSSASFRSLSRNQSNASTLLQRAPSLSPKSPPIVDIRQQFYESPHTYDEPTTPISSRSPLPQYVIAAIDHVDQNNVDLLNMLFDRPRRQNKAIESSEYTRYWQPNANDAHLLTLTEIPCDADSEELKTQLTSLGRRLGITALMIVTGTRFVNQLFDLLHHLDGALQDDHWNERLVLLFRQDYEDVPTILDERKHIYEQLIPHIQSQFRMRYTPVAMCVSVASHALNDQASWLHNRQLLLDILNISQHKICGRWRPKVRTKAGTHNGHYVSDDSDDEATFGPEVDHIGC